MSSPSVLVLGLGSSGVAVARYCAQRLGSGFESVTAVDTADTPALRSVAAELDQMGARVILGASVVEGTYDLAVASPGIPPHAPIMKSARQASREVISEIQFAFERSQATWAAVTGTNGKTTTTALLAHLLAVGGVPARAVGNIGTPAVEVIGETGEGEVLVAEVSSFQLALTSTFRPQVAILLNITPDHIDWHGSLEAYATDKARVFANLGPGDTAVIDVDDPGSAPYAQKVAASGARVVRVGLDVGGHDCATVRGDELVLGDAEGTLHLVPVDELKIRGPHNVSNALAAAAAAHALGVSLSGLREGLTTFEPIEHRLEPVAVVDGVEWFNDSKATNPDAVMKALAAFGDRPLVLLLGGRNKDNDFGPLALEASRTASAVVLFGEARDELAAAFGMTGMQPYLVATLAEAVDAAARSAVPGDAVVLSPACASFDEFDNYGQRGRVFKQLVLERASGRPL